MRRTVFTLISLLSVLCLVQPAQAQQPVSDLQVENLKGYVHVVTSVERGSHNQQLGTPIQKDYNANGNLTLCTYFDTMGKPTIVVHYYYDSVGMLERDLRVAVADNQLLSETHYSHNLRHRQTVADYFGVSDSLEVRTVTEFDKAGRPVDVVLYDGEHHVISRSQSKYDASGNRTEVLYTIGDNDQYQGEEEFRYDTEGNVIESNAHESHRARQRLFYLYDFDAWGNWVVCYLYHMRHGHLELIKTTTRTITYYD